MNVEPEQRAALLGEYIAEHSARCGQPPGRRVQQINGAQGCIHRLRAVDAACLPGCRPCWPATRPSAICGAGRRPGANTKVGERCREACAALPVYLCRNCSSAAFSSRETCAWLMPISRATSIWVSPLR